MRGLVVAGFAMALLAVSGGATSAPEEQERASDAAPASAAAPAAHAAGRAPASRAAVDQPSALTEAECTGLGGKLMGGYPGCGGDGKKCFTTDKNGVIRSACIAK